VLKDFLKISQHLEQLRARKMIVSRSVRLGTVLQNDEERARDLDYGEKQMLLTIVTLILTWLRQLSN